MIYIKRILDIARYILRGVSIFMSAVLLISLFCIMCYIFVVVTPLVVALAVLELFIITPVYYVATGERYYDNFNSILVVWASVPDLLEDDITGFRKKKEHTHN